MANVIPREGLSAVRKRNMARFVFVGAVIFSSAAIVAILSILPAYVSVRVARASVDAVNREAAAESRSEDQQASARTQALLNVLTPIASATSSPSESLIIALSEKPAAISITSISYVAGTKTIEIAGTSAQREAISALRDALEASGRFSNVAVPVAALVGAQEGRFTVTLSGI